ncbi:MAG: leucyl/phenylalanyl-tRNA--protein transferase [Bacteroidetes bacterium MedPE-SWsnd-G2]|nr:MAG: leucyl/phenylalanyl-tRNA--protein transferase [Bacteroidetes bacterium MedPE-SWsnd-G2]
MIYLDDNMPFPDVRLTSTEGLLAIGGELSTERLLSAYRQGIFPWFEEEEPVLWWCPDPRFVLFPSKLKVSKSMKKVLKSEAFKITYNTAFDDVIIACSKVERADQESTWITFSMIKAYSKLHELGYAKSVEVWLDDQLVGGLYGIDLGNGVFCGESMFSTVSNASKAGFISFVQNGNYRLIDCQVYTNHLESLGAEDIDREVFLSYIN